MAMKARMNRNTATSLTVQAKMWLTPRAAEGSRGHDVQHGTGGPSLGLLVRTTTTDGTSGEPKADLNPRFVAALMGVPWDWLSPCTSVETDSYHEWRRKHSPNWRLVLASDDWTRDD